MRFVAAAIAGLLALHPAAVAAAPPPERAAEPFPEVRLPQSPPNPHRAAYLSMLAGAGLVTASFVIHERANRTYSEYLASTDLSRLDELFRRTETQDHWSAAALIGGEVLVATGIYLRFLHRPPTERLTLAAGPGGVAVRWRF